MACFLVPMSEAIVVSILQKLSNKGEKLKLGWLNIMLWGGTILLAFEHIWHGEVSLVPPFLTAMRNPSEIGIMLHEMATNGVLMAVTITFVWIAMVLLYSAARKRELMTAKSKV